MSAEHLLTSTLDRSTDHPDQQRRRSARKAYPGLEARGCSTVSVFSSPQANLAIGF